MIGEKFAQLCKLLFFLSTFLKTSYHEPNISY